MSEEPAGAQLRRRVLGEAYVDGLDAELDPFLASFREEAIRHAWGGPWLRPGLDLKYRSLTVVVTAAVLGRTQELVPHFRGALNLGWTPEELREVCLQIAAYAGYPAAVDALRVLSRVVEDMRAGAQ